MPLLLRLISRKTSACLGVRLNGAATGGIVRTVDNSLVGLVSVMARSPSTARPITAAATLPFPITSRSCIFRPIRRNSIRRKISGMKSANFKNYALKSMDAVRAKLKQAILYIEHNPKLVRSISSFPYIVNSL